jgi:uncharacterized membrane protein YgcG
LFAPLPHGECSEAAYLITESELTELEQILTELQTSNQQQLAELIKDNLKNVEIFKYTNKCKII